MISSVGIAIGFIAPAIGTNYLFGRKSGTLYFIDAGYWMAPFTRRWDWSSR